MIFIDAGSFAHAHVHSNVLVREKNNCQWKKDAKLLTVWTFVGVVWERIAKDLNFLEIGWKLGIASSTAHRIFSEFMGSGT